MIETTFTLRNPPYSYVHLRATHQAQNGSFQKPSQEQDLDEVTLISYMTNALSQYLGLTGTAIPIDILKIEGSEGWIRLPREDENAVVAALSQWMGKGGAALRVLGRGSWLGGLSSGVDDAKLWSLET